MTENSKIFLTKASILNILAQQELSVGLSLYIIKDIEQELEKMYNEIINKELQQNEEKEQVPEEIDMTDSGLTITSFEDIKDQAD